MDFDIFFLKNDIEILKIERKWNRRLVNILSVTCACLFLVIWILLPIARF